MEVFSFALGPLATNCFVAVSDGKAVAVDPGGEPSRVIEALKVKNLTLTHILVTHFHFDHIYGCKALADATGAPIVASPTDAFLLDTELGGGGFMGFPTVEPFAYTGIEPGETAFLDQPCTVLATPGHSPGSLSFYFPREGHLFSGDVIFARSIGRTDFPGGSLDDLLASVREKIFTLPDDTVIHSGHGDATTVGEERLHNPFFSQFRR
ncbi:MAG: MBL fold metallo-hydrolase [Desulfovibrionaceae bacterium]